jgi:hypothetical protein
VYRESITGLCADCLRKDRAAQKPDELLKTDRELVRLRDELSRSRASCSRRRKPTSSASKELHLTNEVGSLEIAPVTIEPREPSGTAEGVAVLNLSDWHVEERVDPATVSYQNEYNLDIAQERAGKCFRSGLRLIRCCSRTSRSTPPVVGLLGDFITGDIHDEIIENCQLRPTEAIEFAQNLIIGGLEHLAREQRPEASSSRVTRATMRARRRRSTSRRRTGTRSST